MKISKFLTIFLVIILTGEIVFFVILVFGILKSKDSTITLFAVGDIMLDRDVKLMVEKESRGDFRFPFLKIAGYLAKADILFGNLESLISNKEGEKAEKTGKVQAFFKAEPEAINGLIYSGFDIVSVANNHAFDYGRAPFEDCLRRLKEAGIEYVGGGFNLKEASSVKIKEIKNTKIGFLAYSGAPQSWQAREDKSGIMVVDEKNIEEIKEKVKEAKKEVDILVISFHWGKEYSLEPTSFQILFDKTLIDAGADLVIGHHSHVVQPLEKYKQGWISYSLGNFIFDQDFSEKTMIGGLLEVTIKNKKIKKVGLKETKITNQFQPFLPESNELLN